MIRQLRKKFIIDVIVMIFLAVFIFIFSSILRWHKKLEIQLSPIIFSIVFAFSSILLRGIAWLKDEIKLYKNARDEIARLNIQLEERIKQRTLQLETINLELERKIVDGRAKDELLAQSEERYRSVVENVGIGIAVISPNMELLTLNKQMQNWFPYADADKKPICYATLNNPPREGKCTYCPTEKTLQDGQVHEAVIETLTIKGLKNYRIVSSPIKDYSGKIVAAIEMVEDITKRKRIEDELKKYQHQLEDLVKTRTTTLEIINKQLEYEVAHRKLMEMALADSEHMSSAILENVDVAAMQLDKSGKVKFANKYLLSLTGYKPEEVIKGDWFELFVPEGPRQEARLTFNKFIGLKQLMPHETEGLLMSRSGSSRLIRWHASLLYDNEGAPAGIAAIGCDLGDR